MPCRNRYLRSPVHGRGSALELLFEDRLGLPLRTNRPDSHSAVVSAIDEDYGMTRFVPDLRSVIPNATIRPAFATH